MDEFERFKKKFNSSSLSAEALAEQLENVDQRIIDYAKTCKNGEMTTEGFKASIDTMSFSAKAGKVALQALAMAGNMLAMWGITEVISGLYEFSQVSETVAKNAKELGDSFKSTSSDIASYKSQIKELYDTINDSSSSVEDVTNARKSLLSIQDELIDKFGTEKDIINDVTDAINGQTDALDRLTNSKWQETKNEFNNDGFWNDTANFFQNTDNIERMLNEYGERTILLKWADYADITKLTDEMVAKLEDIGIDIKVNTDDMQNLRDFDSLVESISNTKGANLTITGNAEEVYNQLLALQNLIGNDDSFSNLYDKVESTANSYKELTDSYKDFYNQYILYEKILTEDSDYVNTFKEITDAYEEYKNAFTSGDENQIKEATENYAKILTNATSTAIANSDSDVASYFESMYPELQSVVEGWKFNITFDSSTDDLQGKVQTVLDELKDENGRSLTTEEILGLDVENEQYQALISIAHDYNMTLEEMIELLKERNLVSAMDYQGLVGLFGQENVDNLSPEDLEIAYTIKNVGNMTFEQLQSEIQKTKEYSDEMEVSFSSQLTSSGESLDNFQESIASTTEAYSKLLSGDYTSSELLDCIQTINKAMSDMGGSINWESLKDQADSLGMLGDEIQNISQAYAESILSDAGIDINSGLGQMLSNVIQQIYDTEAAFGSMNNRIDSIQSSYQTLTGILQSYNETGYINLDNLQSLLTADQNLIAMLQVENGQLVLNQTAYENLVQAQLMEFKVKLDDAAAAEIETLAKQKAEEATNRNADASSTAVAKLDAETAAFNRNTSAAISNAVAKAEESGVSEKDIQDIFDKYNKVWESAQKNYNSDFPSFMGNTASSAKSAAKETEKEVDIMAELNSEMDKLQSAYESLCDIRDTYNKYGKITVDQYQELTDMGFNFLANLVDENGELGLNANAFEKLSQAKLQEMQIQMARNAIDTINGLKSEVEATEYLTYANENLRDAALSATEALLYQAQAAAHLRGEQQGLAADQIVQGYEASKLLAGKVDFTFNPSGKEETEDSKSSGSDELLDAYNAEKKLLEHMLSMDQISKKEYYDRLFDLVHRYFDGDEEHKDQIWDVEESYHDYLESIKETYNWIEVFLSTLAKKTTALIDKAEKFITWSKKNAMINRAVKATNREIAGQTNAYAYYAEKARKVKLSDEYINKIQNGTLTMEDMQNEALSNKIEKYQEWLNCPAT